MKKIWIANSIVLLLLLGNAVAQNEQKHFSIKVVNTAMEPVSGASILLFNYTKEDKKQPKGKSNNNGLLDVAITPSLLVEATVKKEGYYDTRAMEIPRKYYSKGKKDETQPFVIVVKKINSPVAMYAKNLQTEGAGPLTLPKQNENIGYDLMQGDWVAPYGKGKIKDFVFKYTVREKGEEDFERSVTVSFSNEKDGLIPFESSLHKGSELVSDYKARKSGYISHWSQTNLRITGKPLQSTRKKDRNFYFRVRTKLDNKGEIISANYGKIYGDFMSFIYYLNPKPNDLNLEFNTQKNLLKSELWKEEVHQP